VLKSLFAYKGKTEKQGASMRQQKQELDAHNKTATSLIIYKNAQLSYMNGYLNYIYKNSNKKRNIHLQILTWNQSDCLLSSLE
jgi:hypothetical protein